MTATIPQRPGGGVRRPLSVQQVKVTLIAALVLGLISSAFQLLLDIRNEVSQRQTTVAQVMDMLNEPAAQAAYALDEQLAARVVSGLLLYKPIWQAEIYDNYGRRMAAQSRPRESGTQGWLLALLPAGDEILVQPLYGQRDRELVGEMRVAVDGSLLAHSILNRAWVVLVTGLVRNFVLALILAVLFYYTLTRPLLALVGQIERADPRRPEAVRVEVPPQHKDDEFGLLANRINTILATGADYLAERERGRELLLTVLEAIPARISVKDTDGRYMLVNRSLAEAFKIEASEMIGRHLADLPLQTLAPEARERFIDFSNATETEALQAGRAVLNRERTYRDVDGELRTTLESKVPLRGSDGRITAILSVALDISERKHAEQALDEANIRLRRQAEDLERLAGSYAREREHAIAANRAKSEFLANMSHELRTPLNAIIGFAEVIVLRMWGNSSEKYFDYAQDIVVSARHLLHVINDILDMSKIEAGRYELMMEDNRLPAVIDDCLTIVKGRAREAQIAIINDFPDTVPLARFDARAIKQVLLNLLSNAIKFTPAGGQVRIGGYRDSDGNLVISVSDTGVGIRAEYLPRIFEPFWQGNPNVSRSGEGTGLGLAISRKFMELHGGTLEIESAENRGTTAVIRLPAQLVEAS